MKVAVISESGETSNWEIDVEQTDAPQLEISKGDESILVTFEGDNYRRFCTGEKKVEAFGDNERKMFLTSLSRI